MTPHAPLFKPLSDPMHTFKSTKLNMSIGNFFAWNFADEACGFHDGIGDTIDRLDAFYVASEYGIVFW